MAGSKVGKTGGLKLILPAALILSISAAGGISSAPSVAAPMMANPEDRPALQSEVMPGIDRPDWLAEDEIEQAEGLPFRFGAPFETALDLEHSGSWSTLPDGSRIWLLRIRCPGAYSINLVYSRFLLPEGTALFLYNEDGSYVLGPFTAANNKPHGQFSTAPVPGESCILEYRVPIGAGQTGELTVGWVIHGYRDVFAVAKDIHDFGESGSCNINANCPEGIDWGSEKRSVAMIIVGSNRLCSGALVNNARQDLTPYFLTANHCLVDENTWVLMFNYESPGCDPVEGPDWMTLSGATLVSANNSSDFGLVRLQEQPPDSYHVYYAGWSALDEAPDSSVCIHHPSGDIKKISFDFDPAATSEQLGDPGTGLDYWRIGNWDLGTTEGGSSGAPLFDFQHRIIGQLYGGWASCAYLYPDWFGKFARSWYHGMLPEERLMDWLDPDGIGLVALDGRDSEGITIYHIPDSYTGDSLTGWEVTALIVSNCPKDPDSLRLRYEIGDSSDIGGLAPTEVENEFTGSIPANPDGALISYYFTALDSCDQTAVSDTFYIGGPPDDSVVEISVNPAELSCYMMPGQTATDSIFISNWGRVVLTYSLQVDPGANWMTIGSAAEGSVDSAMTDTVPVEFNATGLEFGNYATNMVIDNNDPDQGDNPWLFPVTLMVREWLCGDVNHNGKITLSDVARLIDYVYLSKEPLLYEASGNIDGSQDGLINIGDIVHLINFLYQDGDPPRCEY